jgi:glycosyltransferase involved in cell wall biosynthesis
MAEVPRAPNKPMRILTQALSLDPVGGIELCTLQDSLALAERGHALEVMYADDGVFRSKYASAGINLEGPVSFNFDPRHPLGDLARFVGPARTARSWKPDVLWLSRFEHIFWAQAVARWSKSPIVCQLHHMPNFNRTGLLSRSVSHFAAVSQFMHDAWIDAGLNPDRVSVIDNALPPGQYLPGGMLERESARVALGIPGDVAVVLCYGRVTPEKGVGTLLEAWAALGHDGDDALLVMVGGPEPTDDPELEPLLTRVKPGAIRWFPAQSDVVPFLHCADLVVFPTWLKEGFGRVVIEGMATGRPVLASRVGAVPEILSGAMARFLVTPRDPDDLASAISSLLNWREEEPELEAACAAWVAERYPYKRHVDALESAFQTYRRDGR